MPATRIVDRSDFVSAARSGDASNVGLLKEFSAGIKAAGDDSRTIEGVISTPTPDRMGDILMPMGFDIAAYMRNPIVPWGHDTSKPPVARALSVTKSPTALRAVIEFMTRDLSPFADSIYRMYRQGFLRAFSVGFLPIKYEFMNNGGVKFITQELTEFSCVSVPANSECLAQAKAAGIDVSPLMQALRQSVDPRREALARSWQLHALRY